MSCKPPALCHLETGKLIDTQQNFASTFNWLVDSMNNLDGGKFIKIEWPAPDHPTISYEDNDDNVNGYGGDGIKKIEVIDTETETPPTEYEEAKTLQWFTDPEATEPDDKWDVKYVTKAVGSLSIEDEESEDKTIKKKVTWYNTDDDTKAVDEIELEYLDDGITRIWTESEPQPDGTTKPYIKWADKTDQEIGKAPLGGAGSGVTSLNGATGELSLTSADDSKVTVTVNGQSLQIGVYYL